jgi:hypothetical protein
VRHPFGVSDRDRQFIIGQDGGFAGADLDGVIYTGIARENDVGWITLDIQLTIPAGTTLVQGTAVQDVPHTNSIHAFLPPDFGDGHPQQIQAALGVVTIMVKRVPGRHGVPASCDPGAPYRRKMRRALGLVLKRASASRGAMSAEMRAQSILAPASRTSGLLPKRLDSEEFVSMKSDDVSVLSLE